MAGESLVKPQYGPTLLQLLRRLSRTARVVVITLAAVLAAGAVTIALRSRPDETALIVPGPATFNLVYGPELERVSPPGSLFALRRERADGLFLDSYVVRALTLPAYSGSVGGILPVYAVGYLERMRKRYTVSRLEGEGRTRVNNATGYEIALRAKRRGRTIYVRHLLLVPDEPEGARRGVIIELEATPVTGTPSASKAGDVGPLKTALRSFRFGTSRSGGEQ